MEATFRLSKALPELQGVREWYFLAPSDWERKVTRGILIKLSSFKNFGFFREILMIFVSFLETLCALFDILLTFH